MPPCSARSPGVRRVQASDVDILIDLDPRQRLDLFDYVNIKLHIAALFGVDTLSMGRSTWSIANAQAPSLLRQQILF